MVRQIDGEHWRVAHGQGPLGWETTFAATGGVRLGWFGTELAQTVRGSSRHPTVHFMVDQSARYVRGRQEIAAVPGTAVCVAGGAELTRRGEPGTAFCVEIERDALDAELRARRPDADKVGPLMRFEFTDPRQHALRRAVADLVAAMAEQADSARLAECEAQVIATMADLVGTASQGETGVVISAPRLAAVEDWIESHLAEPITLGSLCAVAGVGERALQMAFRSARGMSPMRFVAERRLAAAHRRLAQARAREDVTAIAMDTGFSHLGRFATLYRQVYGEPPSRTLQRGHARR